MPDRGYRQGEWTCSRCSRHSATRRASRCIASSRARPAAARRDRARRPARPPRQHRPPAPRAPPRGRPGRGRAGAPRHGRPARSTSTRSRRARPGLGFDPPSYTLLAGLLAALAERVGADGDEPTEIGPGVGRRSRAAAPARARASKALAGRDERLGFDPRPRPTGDDHRHRVPALPVPGAGRGLPRAGVQPPPRHLRRRRRRRSAGEASRTSRRCTTATRAGSPSRSGILTMPEFSCSEAHAMIALTDTATTKVKELIEAEGQPELFLRVAVRPGGCSGMSYEMFFDSEKRRRRHRDRRTARSRSSSTRPAPSTSTARRSTTRTASRAPGSRSTTRTRSAPAAAASRSRRPTVAPLRRGCDAEPRPSERARPHLVLTERAVEARGDRAARVDAEEPGLAREVPRGDGRRRRRSCGGSCRSRRARCRRGPGRSSTSGSRLSSTGPQYCDWHRAGVANITATGLPLPITVSSDMVCSGHIGIARADRVDAERVRRSSATRRWARPRRWSARRLAPSPGTRTAASRRRDPRRRPRCLPCRRRVSDDVHAAPFRADRPRAAWCRRSRVGFVPVRRDRDRRRPPGRRTLPSPSIANAKRCGVLDA